MRPPAAPGEALCRPDPARAAARAGEHFQAGPELGLRQALGLDCRRPVVACSHQPEFFHAGIWFRLFVIDEIARREGFQAVYVGLDSDLVRTQARLPCLAGGSLGVTDLELGQACGLPAEAAPAPSPASWERFLHGVEGCLGRPEPRLREAGREALARAEDYADFQMRLRRRLEPVSPLGGAQRGEPRREVRLSALCRTPAFQEFARRLGGEAFREAYNQALRQLPHRPVRPLGPGELPFWSLEAGRRLPARSLSQSLRPRALTLTLFLRLYLCDLFVHGTGGWGYEGANDLLLRDFFCLEGAPVAVATATVAPGLGRREPAAVARELRQLRYVPEKLLADPELARTRVELVGELRSAPRGHRARIHGRLEALNAAGAARLEPVRLRLERELAESEAAWRRDYAYFIHPARKLKELAADLW